jgi:ribosome-binding ATPase YchF (GTP1/OBG family)
MILNLNYLSNFHIKVSAFLEIHDIAGLVRGAHEGQGLGNSFLSHIRAVDGIFHVLRKKLIFAVINV